MQIGTSISQRVGSLMAGAGLVLLAVAPVSAQSAKAAWRYAELVSLGANAAGPTTDTGWQSILTTHIKTPNGKELAIGASLQCGLITDTTVRSRNGSLDTAAGQARIKVRIKITRPDGKIVYAEPDNGADLPGDLLGGVEPPSGVTYCDRFQKLEARFSGLNCTADLTTGVVTCLDPEELRLLLKTMDAHHFNFLYANATPGVHTVEVQARAQSKIELGGTMLGAAGAEAFAGAGALSVETIRLIHDADGTTDLTTLH
jgi:hypothetical protein